MNRILFYILILMLVAISGCSSCGHFDVYSPMDYANDNLNMTEFCIDKGFVSFIYEDIYAYDLCVDGKFESYKMYSYQVEVWYKAKHNGDLMEEYYNYMENRVC